MKRFRMSETTAINVGSYNDPSMGFIPAQQTFNIRTEYSVPYERNDEYLKLIVKKAHICMGKRIMNNVFL